MKRTLQPLWLLALLGGILGFALRLFYLLTGYDSRGLLIPGHPAGIACLVLTAVMPGLLFWKTAGIRSLHRYGESFPASRPAALGCGAAALGFAGNALYHCLRPTPPVFSLVTAVVCTGAFCQCALFRLRGKKPGCGPMSVVTACWMVELIFCYRLWMAEPQLQHYLYRLLMHVTLAFLFYTRATLDTNSTQLRRYVRLCLTGLFFCCLAIPGSPFPLLPLCLVLHLTGELWSICPPVKSPVRQQPQEEPPL